MLGERTVEESKERKEDEVDERSLVFAVLGTLIATPEASKAEIDFYTASTYNSTHIVVTNVWTGQELGVTINAR